MAGARRELGLRVLSAGVLAPLAIAAAYAGGWAFAAFWGLAAIGACWELTQLIGAAEAARLINSAALALAALLFGAGRWPWALGLLALGALFAAARAGAGRRAATLAAGVLAAALLAVPVALRMDGEWGFLAISLLFAVVWSTDIMAYVAGSALAGPKLWPAVSPNKTWSGAAGGMLGGTVAGVALAAFADLANLLVLALICGGLALAAEAGDLGESAFKRRFGAKDSSRLIPGHGGVMDRLDGFFAAALTATVLGILHCPGSTPARGLLLW